MAIEAPISKFKKNNIKVRRFKAFKPMNNYDIERLIKEGYK